MLAPPAARSWDIAGSTHPRYGWDQKYIVQHRQLFSPWFFAKNCAAVLGHVRANGRTRLMDEMSDYLLSVAEPHIETLGSFRYVRNDFEYSFLWHKFRKPFYGAFMNSVTAFGLLQLYEATGMERLILLADRLLMSCCSADGPIPLCSGNGHDFWLHEYVFRSDGGPVEFSVCGDWNLARIYNGHMHALFGFLRFQAMTSVADYDSTIDKATATMAHWLPLQCYDGRYFSYSPDMPIYPDYGQERAVRLAEGLGALMENSTISGAGAAMRELFCMTIAGHEKELIDTGIVEAKKQYAALLRRANARVS